MALAPLSVEHNCSVVQKSYSSMTFNGGFEGAWNIVHLSGLIRYSWFISLGLVIPQRSK